jgi:hypothetical protein
MAAPVDDPSWNERGRPVVKKSVDKRKQRRCDWARLHRTASRFLTPSQLSLYFRLERLPKVRMFEMWTKAAQKDEATFKRVFTDALGFELPDEGVVSGASAGSKAASSEASAAQVPARKALAANCAFGKASALCANLQMLIRHMGDRQMYRDLQGRTDGRWGRPAAHMLKTHLSAQETTRRKKNGVGRFLHGRPGT